MQFELDLNHGTHRFGSIEFTPDSIMENDDEQALVSFEDGVVNLDTTQDNDSSIMVHVYNFENIQNETNDSNGNQSSSNMSVDLRILQWYPKGPDYVFVCDANGFTPTNYTWYYGDGHKLLNIKNQNTYHVYTALGTYNVQCIATDGTNTASDNITITVDSLVRPSNPLFPGNSGDNDKGRSFSCINDATNQSAKCNCANTNPNAASCKCA